MLRVTIGAQQDYCNVVRRPYVHTHGRTCQITWGPLKKTLYLTDDWCIIGQSKGQSDLPTVVLMSRGEKGISQRGMGGTGVFTVLKRKSGPLFFLEVTFLVKSVSRNMHKQLDWRKSTRAIYPLNPFRRAKFLWRRQQQLHLTIHRN